MKGKDKRFDGPLHELPQKASEVEREGRRSAKIIPKEEVKTSRRIGEGAHGLVHEGTWADDHGAVSVGVKVQLLHGDKWVIQVNRF